MVNQWENETLDYVKLETSARSTCIEPTEVPNQFSSLLLITSIVNERLGSVLHPINPCSYQSLLGRQAEHLTFISSNTVCNNPPFPSVRWEETISPIPTEVFKQDTANPKHICPLLHSKCYLLPPLQYLSDAIIGTTAKDKYRSPLSLRRTGCIEKIVSTISLSRRLAQARSDYCHPAAKNPK